MDNPLHFADQALTAVAGASFIISYLIGLRLGVKMGLRTLWPAILVTLIGFIVRPASAPLGFAAIAAISAVHLGIGSLTTLLLQYTKPFRTVSSR